MINYCISNATKTNLICITSKQNQIKMFVKHICPFPNLSRIGLTFDLDLSPTDLDIDRDHLLIKDYLPTKFEAPRAKRS